eukprot:tig00001214_g7552.t1
MRPYTSPDFEAIVSESRRRSEAKTAVANLGFGGSVAAALLLFGGVAIAAAGLGLWAVASTFKLWVSLGVVVLVYRLVTRASQPISAPLSITKEAVKLFGIPSTTPKDKIGSPAPAQTTGPISPAVRSKLAGPKTSTPTVPKSAPATPMTPAQRRTSSPGRRSAPRDRINDESALSRFLGSIAWRSPSTPAAAAAAAAASPLSGAARPLGSPAYGYAGSPLGSPHAGSSVYRAAPPASPSPAGKAWAASGEGEKAASLVEKGGLEELGIGSEAVDRLRHFLCARIIKLFVQTYDANAAALQRAAAAAPAAPAPFSAANPFGAGFATPAPRPTPAIAGPGASAILAAAQASAPAPAPAAAAAKAGCTAGEYLARYPADPVVQEHARLQRYLTVPGRAPQPEYVLHRLREFAQDSSSCLYSYRWSSGTMWKSRMWSPELPTDAEVLLAVLCAALDLSYEGRGLPAGDANFSARHVAWAGEDPAKKRSPIVLTMTTAHPPHFRVVAYQEVYNPDAGRANFFEAFLILLHLLKSKFPAQLGPLAAVDQSLGLLNVL